MVRGNVYQEVIKVIIFDAPNNRALKSIKQNWQS